MDSETREADYLALVDGLVLASAGTISALGAGILVAVDLEMARDSRTFARLFGIAHALVLREITTLDGAGLIATPFRDARTQRTTLALTDAALARIADAAKQAGDTPLDATISPVS